MSNTTATNTTAANLRVLALAPYPALAASTRYRLSQFVAPLAVRRISLEVRPFLDDEGMHRLYGGSTRRKVAAVGRGIIRRACDALRLRDFDVVLVQREAMLVGPPVLEWLTAHLAARPLVLDLDDPIWLPESSLVPSSLSWIRNWPGKAGSLLSAATLVTCGNSVLADHVTSRGVRARLVPNAVDLGRFRPMPRCPNRQAVVGWIGSHSTYPYLSSLLPSLQEVARFIPFRLRVIGSGRTSVAVEGVPVDAFSFSLERETEDFSCLDVGLYPLADDPWAAGKSGLKAIQYMACGVPYIASPVGVVADIGLPGVTHLVANTAADWQEALLALLRDPERRVEMGAAGRRHAESNHGIERSADALASALREAAGA